MRRIVWMARGAVVGALMLSSTTALCQESGNAHAALAGALRGKHVTLAKALTSAHAQGKPISAKYEVEDAKLQLSVYTEKNSQFFEVVVDPLTGKVVKTERITEGDDFTAAQAQAAALGTVYAPLDTAVKKALRENPGYVAVSAMPALDAGQAIVTVTLLKGTRFKTVTEKLT
jgi:uncharacterized membrane protein YkoI